MTRLIALAVVVAGPAAAQDHMHGMTMPDHAEPVTPPAPPPPVPRDHYADRTFGSAAMAAARATMMRDSGGQRFAQVTFNLAEYRARGGRDGYRWDGEGWFGGDIDRAVVRTEGSGDIRGGVEAAEVQALYSRAIGPYVDLQAGLRQDLGPRPRRTYATLGVEGLLPYMLDAQASLFLSTRGELTGRVEGWYDQRITQRLVLQPRVELNLSAQDVPAARTGAGLSDAELGLRLRYEIAREFAPYVGVSYDAALGHTARYARADGREVRGGSVVAGVRFWF